MLGEADRSKYFPFVPLRGNALSGAILAAEIQANTAAGRNLELTKYTETIQAFTELVTLRYYPVSSYKPMQVEAACGLVAAGPYHASFLDRSEMQSHGQAHGHSPEVVYTDIDCSQYQVNQDGLLRISGKLTGCWLRITYWAGFDFSSESIEVQQLKAAVAAILNYEAAQ